MEKTVIYRDNQELQSADFINQQGWAQSAIDHVIYDTLSAGKAYSGFATTKAQQTTVQVTPGRLYNAGKVFARNETVTLDLYNDLPVVTKRQYAVVVWGQTIQTDVQPRNFLVDADTGLSQPQSVSMEEDRYCNVEFVRGVESADPQIPPTDANVTVVAYVTCDTTGIISVAQNSATQIDNLTVVSMRTQILESMLNSVNGQIQTLRTDLANLARSLFTYTPLAEFNRLVDIVNELSKKVNRPAAFLWAGTDHYLDESQSAPGTSLDSIDYEAYINEGLRFPPSGASATTALALLNSSDPQALVTDDFLLPKPSGSRVRLDCSFPGHDWLEDRILNYTYHSYHVRHLRPSRWRHCVGRRYIPSPTALVWGLLGGWEPYKHVFSFLAETWEDKYWKNINDHSDEEDCDWPRPGRDRDHHYWRDWVHLPYWSKDASEHDHNGQHIAQTFLNAQDGWLTSVTVYLMKPYWQPLDLVLTGCTTDGEPDHSHTVHRMTIDGETLQSCTDEPIHITDVEEIDGPMGYFDGESWSYVLYPQRKRIPIYVYAVRIPIKPTFLRAGQRYALHISSTYDHAFAHSNRFECHQAHQGHFWHSHADGFRIWNQATPKSLRFKLHYATWGRWPEQGSGYNNTGGGLRYEMNLTPWQLAGGIHNVEVLTRAIIPEATDVSYQVQIAGAWKSFKGGDESPDFTSNPALLPARVLFTGTTDLMPGIALTPSQVTLTGPQNNDFHHISEVISLGGTAIAFKVQVRVHGFDEAHHDLTCALHYGATHNTTSTMTEEIMSDGSLERTWLFTGLSVTDLQIELDGVTDSTVPDFVVSQGIRYAQAA